MRCLKTILLLGLIGLASGLDLSFSENGYKNLIVSISPDSDSSNQEDIIEGIKVNSYTICKINF